MTMTATVNAAGQDLARDRPASEERVSARVWLYPPRLRSRTVPSQAILAAATSGVDIEIGDVSIGIEGARHNVFTAIEQIFSGMEASTTDVVLIATVQRDAR
jgi:hypothetical protein